MATEGKREVARLLAVGDIYFDRADIERPYNEFDSMLQEADFRFCNYEAPITANLRPTAGRGVPLRTPPGNYAALQAGRFDAISLANNHILDYGIDALEETLELLDRTGAPYMGAGRTLEAALSPVIVERSGIHFGFLAFACAFPPEYAATAAQPGLAPVRIRTSYVPNHAREAEHPGSPPGVATAPIEADVAAMKQAVGDLKRQVDHVIVSYHWGVPGRHDLLDYQSTLGHATIDVGASVVLGHHAHVLQPVEVYGRGLIIYGLSHFIFDLPDIISRFGFDTETAAASIDFARDEIRGASLLPVVMEEGSGPRRPESDEAERIGGLLRELSAPLGTVIEWDREHSAARVVI